MAGIKFPKILKNSITGIVASLVSTLSLYGIRIIISQVLGDEIYGVNSIFISIVSAFLILELGMSTAMIIVMYQPVADNDREKIKSILGFYKKFYRCFCLILLSMGIIADIFLLKSFIKSSLDFTSIRLYFILYLLSIIFKYLWSYKSCLLYANKQNSVISIVAILVTVVFSLAEIVCIIVWKNYWLYLILFLLQNITQNAICNIYANKHYPYITEKNVRNLEATDKKKLIGIVKPMFVQRLANQLQDASGVVILGAVGTSAIIVGFFSNYILVTHACQTIFNQIGAAFTTSFGSFSAKNNDSGVRFRYYKLSRFCMSWVAIIFATCYLCLIQTFIEIFFGPDCRMSDLLAIVFSCYVFIVLNSSVNLSIQNAVGAHYLDTKEMIIQAMVGIALSIVAGYFFGSIGVISGMLISVAVFTGFIKGIKIFKSIFNESTKIHIFMLLKEIACFAVVSSSSYLLYTFVLKPSEIISFILSAMVIFIVSNVEMLIINIRSENLAVLKKNIKNILHIN